MSVQVDSAAERRVVSPSRKAKAKGLTPSAILGYVVALGSVGVKIPQIQRLFASKSVAGLSLFMYALELGTQSVAIFYSRCKGFPLSSYGENVSLGLSNIAILIAFAKYAKAARSRFLAKMVLTLPLLVSLAPAHVLKLLQSLNIPLYLASRVPQIASNYTTQSTGELSLLTFLGCGAGSLVRLSTTIKEMDSDIVMLSAFTISVLLNMTVVAQIQLYKALPALAQ
jgi:mannose-P-dolichol utilization defect protein 1